MARVLVLANEPNGFPADIHDLINATFTRFHLRSQCWNPIVWAAASRAMREFGPDVLHCVGLQGLRLAAVVNRKGIPFVYSGVDLGGMDRITRRYAARGLALVSTESEREALARFGLRAERIPVGVAAPSVPADHSDEHGSQVILFGGGLDEASDPRQAAWAFDCLKYALPGAEVVFLGRGPQEGEIRRFSFGLGYDDYRVRFAPNRERPEWLQRAGVVWLTHPRGGAPAMLSALARGLPVVAMHTSEIAEYASEGLTLVPAGDRIALASATLKLFRNPRPAVPVPRFPISAMVQKYAAVYDALAGSAA
jgi:glycosyltransferase involved in cell wall biosynthesis